MADLVVSIAMANTKPFVQLACLCEKAVQDAGGVLTLVRVIDTVYTGLLPDAPPGAVPTIEYDCIVSLKSGDLVGSFDKLSLRLMMPGATEPLYIGPKKTITTSFNGGSHGINVRAHLVLEVKEYGLAWIDVLWGDEEITRIPLHLKTRDQMPKPKD